MTPETGKRFAYVMSFTVIAVAVTGFFVGLQSPNRTRSNLAAETNLFEISEGSPEYHSASAKNDPDAILALSYSEMATSRKASTWQTSLAELNSKIDRHAEFTITPEQKHSALELREQNRAFNGAPPTVPHAIQQMSDTGCIACHGEGFSSESLKISKMPHQYLANCTQCHVESNPTHMTVSIPAENSFSGLPAPGGGERAYFGAPPTIPHSTWMRVDCMSCHGFASQQGIRTTHPWRNNCQQCHAPSSQLDQTQLREAEFLQPPTMDKVP